MTPTPSFDIDTDDTDILPDTDYPRKHTSVPTINYRPYRTPIDANCTGTRFCSTQHTYLFHQHTHLFLLAHQLRQPLAVHI